MRKLTAFISIILLLSILSACNNQASADDDSKFIYGFVTSNVKDQLTSPSSAKFQPFEDATVDKVSEGKWFVTGDFTSDNVMGAALDDSFAAIVTSEDGKSYDIETLKFMNEDKDFMDLFNKYMK